MWITRLDFMLIIKFAFPSLVSICIENISVLFMSKFVPTFFAHDLSTNLMEFLLCVTSSIYIFNWRDAIHVFRNCFKCYIWVAFKIVLSKFYSIFRELSIDSHFIISQRHITHISMSLFIIDFGFLFAQFIMKSQSMWSRVTFI